MQDYNEANILESAGVRSIEYRHIPISELTTKERTIKDVMHAYHWKLEELLNSFVVTCEELGYDTYAKLEVYCYNKKGEEVGNLKIEHTLKEEE